MRLPRIKDKVFAALARETSSGRFIAEIDGLRFVAILSVVMFHLNINASEHSPLGLASHRDLGTIYHIAKYGFFGVQLFFVISGFILAVPFAEHYLMGGKRVRLGSYYFRRVTRLEPPYFINLLAYTFLIARHDAKLAGTIHHHLGASMLYLHNFLFKSHSAINMVAWSLEVEVQFYVLVPILVLLFRVRNTLLRRLLIAATAVGIMRLAEAILPPVYFGYSVARFLPLFMAGFLLADLYLVTWKRRPVKHWAWDLGSVAAWVAFFGTCSGWIPHDSVTMPAAILAAYACAFRGPLSNRIFRNTWVTTTGGMCYTIYLYHTFLLGLFRPPLSGIAFGTAYGPYLLLQAALVVPLVIGSSAVLFALFEKPFMRRDWPQRLAAAVRGKRQIA